MSTPRTSARLPDKLWLKLEKAVLKSGQSESTIVRLAIAEFLDRYSTPTAIIERSMKERSKAA